MQAQAVSSIVTKNPYSGLTIPSPLPEQHRIVARIEELFSRLDAGVEALRRAKAQLQRYRQSVLKAAVEGRLTAEWRAAHPEVEPAEKLLKQLWQEKQNVKKGKNVSNQSKVKNNCNCQMHGFGQNRTIEICKMAYCAVLARIFKGRFHDSGIPVLLRCE